MGSQNRVLELRVGVAADPQQPENAEETPQSLWLTTELFLSGKLSNGCGAVHNTTVLTVVDGFNSLGVLRGRDSGRNKPTVWECLEWEC